MVASDEKNYVALVAALEEVRAEFNMLNPLQHIPVTLDHLATSTGPMLLRTRYGRLDVLREAGGETFESLTSDAEETSVTGHVFKVASLPALYRMKRAANRPKDRAVLPRIEAALRARGEAPD